MNTLVGSASVGPVVHWDTRTRELISKSALRADVEVAIRMSARQTDDDGAETKQMGMCRGLSELGVR
jgi:hypothetical protein